MLTFKTVLLTTASALLALTLVQPAMADERSAPRIVLATQGSSQIVPSMAAINVDESALYYYAQNNQHGRVDAEILRLRSMHPQWMPPADLYQGGVYNRDQELWDMFAEQETDAIHAEVARRMAQEPGWQPPLDLMDALERVEQRQALLRDFNAGNTGAIVAAVEANPALLDSDDLEVLWLAGGAYAREQKPDIAAQMFDIALRAASTPAELSGTLYNARDALPSSHTSALFATGQSIRAGQAGYEEVIAQFQLDLHRDQLGADLETWRVDPDTAHALSRDAVAAIEANWSASPSNDATPADLVGDYELVGWAYYAMDDHRRALSLFRRALASAHLLRPDSAVRYGSALALRDLGDVDGALNMLEQGLPDPNRQDSGQDTRQDGVTRVSLSGDLPQTDDRSMALYIELLGNALYGLDGSIALTLQRVARHTHYVGLLENASGAEALGWYAYRSEQLPPAAAWFSKSLEWRSSPSAAEGLVRSTWRLGEHDTARTQLASYTSSFPELASLGSDLTEAPARQAVTRSGPSPARSTSVAAASQAQRSGNPRRCLSLLEGVRASHEVTLIRAWCLLDLGRSHEAATAFAGVETVGSASLARDAGYGHALAMLRQGRTFDALGVARNADLSEEQRAVVARSALADQANQAFDAGHYGDVIAALDRRARFAQETRDLTILRAWSLLRLNASQDARQLFEALDRQLSTRETQQGLAAVPSPTDAWMAN